MLEKNATHGSGEGKDRLSKKDTRAQAPVDYIPTWEIPVVLKGADLAMKSGERVLEWIKSEGPLSIHILDSRPHGERYQVEIRATNLTMHGLYVESIALVAPVERSLRMSPNGGNTFGEGDGGLRKEDGPSKPMLIPSGKTLEFTVEFPMPSTKELETGWFKSKKHLGVARVAYLILNEESSRKRDVTFSIRVA